MLGSYSTQFFKAPSASKGPCRQPGTSQFLLLVLRGCCVSCLPTPGVSRTLKEWGHYPKSRGHAPIFVGVVETPGRGFFGIRTGPNDSFPGLEGCRPNPPLAQSPNSIRERGGGTNSEFGGGEGVGKPWNRCFTWKWIRILRISRPPTIEGQRAGPSFHVFWAIELTRLLSCPTSNMCVGRIRLLII